MIRQLMDLYHTDPLSRRAVNLTALTTVVWMVALIWPNTATILAFIVLVFVTAGAVVMLLLSAKRNMRNMRNGPP